MGEISNQRFSESADGGDRESIDLDENGEKEATGGRQVEDSNDRIHLEPSSDPLSSENILRENSSTSANGNGILKKVSGAAPGSGAVLAVPPSAPSSGRTNNSSLTYDNTGRLQPKTLSMNSDDNSKYGISKGNSKGNPGGIKRSPSGSSKLSNSLNIKDMRIKSRVSWIDQVPDERPGDDDAEDAAGGTTKPLAEIIEVKAFKNEPGCSLRKCLMCCFGSGEDDSGSGGRQYEGDDQDNSE